MRDLFCVYFTEVLATLHWGRGDSSCPSQLTEQTDAEATESLDDARGHSLRDSPALLVPAGSVVSIQRQTVQVAGQTGGKLGDGRQRAWTGIEDSVKY